MAKFTVYGKSGEIVSQANTKSVKVIPGEVVKLDLAKNAIKGTLKVGNKLVIVEKDGSRFEIDDFFKKGADGAVSKVAIEDGGAMYLASATDNFNGLAFSSVGSLASAFANESAGDIDPSDGTVQDGTETEGYPFIIPLVALAAVGAVVAIAQSGGSSSDDKDFIDDSSDDDKNQIDQDAKNAALEAANKAAADAKATADQYAATEDPAKKAELKDALNDAIKVADEAIADASNKGATDEELEPAKKDTQDAKDILAGEDDQDGSDEPTDAKDAIDAANKAAQLAKDTAEQYAQEQDPAKKAELKNALGDAIKAANDAIEKAAVTDGVKEEDLQEAKVKVQEAQDILDASDERTEAEKALDAANEAAQKAKDTADKYTQEQDPEKKAELKDQLGKDIDTANEAIDNANKQGVDPEALKDAQAKVDESQAAFDAKTTEEQFADAIQAVINATEVADKSTKSIDGLVKGLKEGLQSDDKDVTFTNAKDKLDQISKVIKDLNDGNEDNPEVGGQIKQLQDAIQALRELTETNKAEHKVVSDELAAKAESAIDAGLEQQDASATKITEVKDLLKPINTFVETAQDYLANSSQNFDALKEQIESLSKKIIDYEAYPRVGDDKKKGIHLDSIEDRIAAIDADKNKKIDDGERKALDQLNNDIYDHNVLVTQYKALIEQYNAQAKEFNGALDSIKELGTSAGINDKGRLDDLFGKTQPDYSDENNFDLFPNEYTIKTEHAFSSEFVAKWQGFQEALTKLTQDIWKSGPLYTYLDKTLGEKYGDKSFLKNLFDKIGEFSEIVIGDFFNKVLLLPQAFNSDLFKLIPTILGSELSGTWAGVKSFFGNILSGFVDGFKGGVAALSEFKWWSPTGGIAKFVTGFTTHFLKDVILKPGTDFFEKILEKLNKALENTTKFPEDPANKATTSLTNARDMIQKWVDERADLLKNYEETITKLSKSAPGLFESIGHGIESVINLFKEGFFSTIGEVLSSTFKKPFNLVKDAVDGIKSLFDGTGNIIENLFKGVKDYDTVNAKDARPVKVDDLISLNDTQVDMKNLPFESDSSTAPKTDSSSVAGSSQSPAQIFGQVIDHLASEWQQQAELSQVA